MKDIDKLMSLPLSQWPTYSGVVAAVSYDNGIKSYQGQQLNRFDVTFSFFENNAQDYCKNVSKCLKVRLAWSGQKLIKDIISVLATQGWEKLVRESIPLDGLRRLVSRFAIPLQSAGVDTTKVSEEFELLLQYAIEFLSLSTLEYRRVWWRLFNCPSAAEWSNALSLAQLLLSLPASNGKLERSFSQMNIIKINKHSLLSNNTLDDLLLIAVDGTPLTDFNPNSAIDLWWKDKKRRPNQQKQKSCEQIPSQGCSQKLMKGGGGAHVPPLHMRALS